MSHSADPAWADRGSAWSKRQRKIYPDQDCQWAFDAHGGTISIRTISIGVETKEQVSYLPTMIT